MKKRYSIFFVLLFIFANAIRSPLFAQITDTLKLNEVNISPRFTDFSVTQKLHKIDSFLLSTNSVNNIGQLLQNINNIFIKSYGPSSSSTTSIRGGSAEQTAVTWNGFNIKNTMLGQNDLSILSTFMTDEVTLQYGGSTATWGSGAVAGAIHLRNQLKFNAGTETNILINFGSFENKTFGLKASFSEKNFSTSTRLIQRVGKNNFSYNDADGNNKNLSHAQIVQYGIMHEDHFKIKKNQLISFRYWGGLTERNMPPSLQQAISTAYQKDNYNRISLEYQIIHNKIKLQVRNGFFAEGLCYKDSVAQINSNAICINSISEAELLYSKNKQNSFHLAINNTYSSATTDEYITKATQNNFSVFGGYLVKSKKEKIAITLNARKELTRNKFQPFTVSGAFVLKLFKALEIKGSLNKLYRLPTLNNLYWNPGGNKNLLPEAGYSEDISLKAVKKISVNTSEFKLESEATIFNRQIKNWIIWLPAANGIWTPQNLMQVWSRGLETNSAIYFSFKRFNLKLHFNTNYILSTNQKSKKENDASIYQQLIYTPVYSGSAGIQINYKYFYFDYSHSYTGYRYTSSDNLSYLLPYELGNFCASYKIVFKETSIDINMQINNVWNKNYTVIAQRPMPLSNYLIGLKINFIKPLKKTSI